MEMIFTVRVMPTVRVDKRENVEIVVVEESLGDIVTSFDTINDLLCDIFNDLSSCESSTA